VDVSEALRYCPGVWAQASEGAREIHVLLAEDLEIHFYRGVLFENGGFVRNAGLYLTLGKDLVVVKASEQQVRDLFSIDLSGTPENLTGFVDAFTVMWGEFIGRLS
jgi:hypothetical protein